MHRMIVAFAAIGVGLSIGCDEQKEATYKTAALAAKDGAFDRGWLPAVLFPDASEIREDHDLDSNRGKATFRPTVQLARRVEQQCSRIPQEQAFPMPFKERASAHGTQYKCGAFVLVLDMDNARGYMWH